MNGKIECTLCRTESKRYLEGEGRRLPFCDVCMGAILDAPSAPGRVLRRAARLIIRRIAMRLHADVTATEGWRKEVYRARDKWRANPDNKIKIDARDAIMHALKSGKLVRPDACTRCGDVPPPVIRSKGKPQSQIWFHHTHGYEEEFWLIGEWLCRHCHMLSEPNGPKRRLTTERV